MTQTTSSSPLSDEVADEIADAIVNSIEGILRLHGSACRVSCTVETVREPHLTTIAVTASAVNGG